MVQVMSSGALHADAIVASTMPTMCSRKCHGHYIDSSHADLMFPASGTAHLPATTSSGAKNNTLQIIGEASMNTPTGYSTHVFSWPWDALGAPAEDISTDMCAEVLMHIGGMSLFQELSADISDAWARMLSEDVVCEEELADQVLTQIGSLSLFVEIDMDTHHEQETDKPRRCLENGIGQVRVVFLVVLAVKCKLQPLLLREMQCGITKLWDPGISQAQTIFFYPRSFLSGGDWLVLDRLPPADRNSSHGKEGLERVHSVLDKISSWSYDSFHLWGRNAFRTRSDKHLNIMDVSNGDLLLHRHEEWSYIHADQIIKAAKFGHTLQQLACFWEYVCSTYCLQFNPCQIFAVKAHIAFKVRLGSCSAIEVATPCSYLLMHQIAYMG
jgi:hypothetical protein